MKKLCSRCQGKEYRRLNREGFFERKFLTFFGIYPWECALCRHKVYLRGSGYRTRSQDARSADSRTRS